MNWGSKDVFSTFLRDRHYRTFDGFPIYSTVRVAIIYHCGILNWTEWDFNQIYGDEMSGIELVPHWTHFYRLLTSFTERIQVYLTELDLSFISNKFQRSN